MWMSGDEFVSVQRRSPNLLPGKPHRVLDSAVLMGLRVIAVSRQTT
jgi:hypothetical protein